MKINVITATQFIDYSICSQLYFYNHIEGFIGIPFKSNEKAKKGELIHKLIEFKYENKPINEELINSDKSVKNSLEYYSEKYHLEKNDNIFNEFSFNIPLEIEDTKFILKGRVDRVIKENDSIKIIDWKTTSKITKFSNYKSFLQLEFYAYCLSKLFQISTVEVEIVYLDAKKAYKKNFISEDLALLDLKIINILKKFNYYEPKYIPNPIMLEKDVPYCKLCNFYSMCEDFI